VKHVVVIGGGVGGLTAATRLAVLGHRVQLLEARSDVGGLASEVSAGGLAFDGGPYILLDKPGLEWAFERINADIATLDLRPVSHLYELQGNGRPTVRIFLDLQRTVAELEQEWPGAGRAYERLVLEMDAWRRTLAPLLLVSRPSVLELARRGALGAAPFLLRSLGSVLGRSGLPREVVDAIAIWTHIAGQTVGDAASVMAFVPALIHRVGAFVPRDGMRVIPQVLYRRAIDAGVDLRCGARVRRIRSESGRVTGVDVEESGPIACDAVISSYHGVGTYDELVDQTPTAVRQRLRALPLQSPGMCAYIAAEGRVPDSYLRFRFDANGVLTLAIAPHAVDASQTTAARMPMRLVAPLDHRLAGTLDEDAQRTALRAMVDDSWWRDGLSRIEVLAARTPRQWGRDINLYRDSMNPSMNRRLMLRGRLAHRSPWIGGLYLAGASTHPGQWVSFCAISGVLAANALHADAQRA
jgi:phytoene dehydrogenase-like protein